MRLLLPDTAAPVRFTFDPAEAIGDDEFFKLCVANSDLRLERSACGEIIIVPPAGPESDHRSLGIASQLFLWAERDGRGKAFGTSTAFILLNGAAYGPDAAWVSNHGLAKFSKQQKRKFLPVAPEFVVEVMSPSDRLTSTQEKMTEWIQNGLQLGWLIDADRKTVYVYRPHREAPEQHTGITSLAGEGPVEGFVVELSGIWAGL